MTAMRCTCCGTSAPDRSYTFAEANSKTCSWCAGEHDRSRPDGWRDSAAG